MATQTLDRERELELITRAQGGDTRAFGTLMTAHRNHLWAVCLQTTGHHQDAEDAMQNALTAIWQNLHKFRAEARFSTWMHRIASNAALMIIRKRREEPDSEAASDEVSTAPRIDEQITDVSIVRTALAQLPDDFREAIVLREYGGLTYAEIAAHQQIPVQTVKSRLNRARKQLVELLGAAGINR
ncbi:RNA polymerase sigma factor [Corynebacterium ulceribovis]|uniref:RNA polymerase sigma factor n=1 Tax=Corynebacterium ulceribovis TaxID=487732 RepID=UPI000377ABB3|nr:sigma-70 family RNA polymerase sigma factor [Corynebacterium ulceribovis]